MKIAHVDIPGEVMSGTLASMKAVTARVFRRPVTPVHGTLFAPADAEPGVAVLVIGGSGGSEPSNFEGPKSRVPRHRAGKGQSSY
jgi:hypothetical protein